MQRTPAIRKHGRRRRRAPPEGMDPLGSLRLATRTSVLEDLDEVEGFFAQTHTSYTQVRLEELARAREAMERSAETQEDGSGDGAGSSDPNSPQKPRMNRFASFVSGTRFGISSSAPKRRLETVLWTLERGTHTLEDLVSDECDSESSTPSTIGDTGTRGARLARVTAKVGRKERKAKKKQERRQAREAARAARPKSELPEFPFEVNAPLALSWVRESIQLPESHGPRQFREHFDDSLAPLVRHLFWYVFVVYFQYAEAGEENGKQTPEALALMDRICDLYMSKVHSSFFGAYRNFFLMYVSYALAETVYSLFPSAFPLQPRQQVVFGHHFRNGTYRLVCTVVNGIDVSQTLIEKMQRTLFPHALFAGEREAYRLKVLNPKTALALESSKLGVHQRAFGKGGEPPSSPPSSSLPTRSSTSFAAAPSHLSRSLPRRRPHHLRTRHAAPTSSDPGNHTFLTQVPDTADLEAKAKRARERELQQRARRAEKDLEKRGFDYKAMMMRMRKAYEYACQLAVLPDIRKNEKEISKFAHKRAFERNISQINLRKKRRRKRQRLVNRKRRTLKSSRSFQSRSQIELALANANTLVQPGNMGEERNKKSKTEVKKENKKKRRKKKKEETRNMAANARHMDAAGFKDLTVKAPRSPSPPVAKRVARSGWMVHTMPFSASAAKAIDDGSPAGSTGGEWRRRKGKREGAEAGAGVQTHPGHRITFALPPGHDALSSSSSEVISSSCDSSSDASLHTTSVRDSDDMSQTTGDASMERGEEDTDSYESLTPDSDINEYGVPDITESRLETSKVHLSLEQHARISDSHTDQVDPVRKEPFDVYQLSPAVERYFGESVPTGRRTRIVTRTLDDRIRAMKQRPEFVNAPFTTLANDATHASLVKRKQYEEAEHRAASKTQTVEKWRHEEAASDLRFVRTLATDSNPRRKRTRVEAIISERTRWRSAGTPSVSTGFADDINARIAQLDQTDTEDGHQVIVAVIDDLGETDPGSPDPEHNTQGDPQGGQDKDTPANTDTDAATTLSPLKRKLEAQRRMRLEAKRKKNMRAIRVKKGSSIKTQKLLLNLETYDDRAFTNQSHLSAKKVTRRLARTGDLMSQVIHEEMQKVTRNADSTNLPPGTQFGL